jgi:Protein of unknown function (DUF732)
MGELSSQAVSGRSQARQGDSCAGARHIRTIGLVVRYGMKASLRLVWAAVVCAGLSALWTTWATSASADAVAYLVNVTVRPGYHFANAEQALAYGQQICEKVDQNRPYGLLLRDVASDFETTDEYQAAYLINQAANELCPAQIWRLRQAAVGYRPGA